MAQNRFQSNKFGATKQTYNGYSYDSKKEAAYAQELDWMIKAGEVVRWERQVKLDLRINGVHWRNYFIDFKVEMADGSFNYVEIKGFPTEVWKMKFDITKILFDELTEGETAHLYLNEKKIISSFHIQSK